MSHTDRMSPFERRASIGLAGIFGLRMLGMFLILPVFAVYASHLPGGDNHTLIGLALGAYGLTQALLQLPFGMASDHFGRKRVIYFGLVIFALGSFVAAFADNIYMVILGRAIQGAGAISAAVTALTADLTREEHRTTAMAMIGGTIGVTFAVSLVAGPGLYHFIGVPGIFALTGVLAVLAIFVVKYVIPNPHISRFHSDAEAAPAKLRDVLHDGQLLRLNFGIFALHAAQMAMFVVIPFALSKTAGLDTNHHWEVYLPVMVAAFALMVPAIIYGEKRGRLKAVFVGAISLMLLTQVGLVLWIDLFWPLMALLVTYFVAFNVLEASLPSIITKLAPAEAKGTAMGVYNTSQSLGLFVGGMVGGYLSHRFGFSAVFAFGAVLMAVWLMVAASMKAPPAVKSRMFHIPQLSPERAKALAQRLAAVTGVAEVSVLADEGVAILKVNMAGWDEQGVTNLIEGVN